MHAKATTGARGAFLGPRVIFTLFEFKGSPGADLRHQLKLIIKLEDFYYV